MSSSPSAIKPFSPEEALSNKISTLPPEVLQAVNTLLSERYDGRTASFTQDEVVKRIRKLLPRRTEQQMLDSHWLDFEKLYEKEGWAVTFDKPGYNESYEASWTFKKRILHND